MNSGSWLRTDVERILFAIYNQDQEECLSGLAALRAALFALSGLWVQERGLLGTSQCYSIFGAGTWGGTRGGQNFIEISVVTPKASGYSWGWRVRLCVPFPVLGMNVRSLYR